LIALMQAGDFRAVPIVWNGKFVGIISDRDIRKYWQNREGALRKARLCRKIRSAFPLTRTSTKPCECSLSYKVGGLPVIRENELVGIITATDTLI
jgi:CBS domain-containing protein